MAGSQFSDQAIIDALEAAGGRVSRAAEALGCVRQTIHSRCLEVEAVREARDKYRVLRLEKAEQVLDDMLDSRDEKIKLDTAKFVARTLGRDHYTDRRELTGANGNPLGFGFIEDPGEYQEEESEDES